MILHHCHLEFHDNLFYETRTLGRLYETGRLIHNIALCYALGLAQTDYHHAADVPAYTADLAKMAAEYAGVYVTPAAGLDVRYSIHTFKLGEERSAVKMEKSNDNRPTYGRAKEIAVGSRFAFGVLSPLPLRLPRWIRLGLWMSKAHLAVVHQVPLHERHLEPHQEREVSVYPINPADLPSSASVRVFDLVSMRPSSLIENAMIEAADWWTGDLPNVGEVWLPAGIRHTI